MSVFPRVADPHHIDADPDPDPAVHFDAGPDPASQNDADTDPEPLHWLAELYFHLFTINASLLPPLKFLVYFYSCTVNSFRQNTKFQKAL
jgi:hypothetical protein